MELKAIYKKKPDCQSCIDLGLFDAPDCITCIKMSTEEVDILTFTGDKAVIAKKSGELRAVSLSELTIQKKESL